MEDKQTRLRVLAEVHPARVVDPEAEAEDVPPAPVVGDGEVDARLVRDRGEVRLGDDLVWGGEGGWWWWWSGGAFTVLL